MSKSNVKKIQVDATKCNADLRRPSVFERLGTKPISIATTQQQTVSDYCRNWALNGSCSYGKTCKYASTHTLISPSKRVKKDFTNASTVTPKEDHFKRITSKLVSQTPQSPDLDLEEWNQTDLEYEDEKVLERRRQLLQKELELQMKKDKEVHGKDRSKHKKKAMSTSSSSHSSSTSSSSSSSSSDDSSTSSTSDSHKKIKKIKRHIVNNDEKERKKKIKLKRLVAQKDNKIIKKKKKIDIPTTSTTKRDGTNANVKRVIVGNTRKHNDIKSRSPIPMLTTTTAAAASTTSKSIINKDKNHSESPKLKSRDDKEQRIHRKGRDYDDSINFQDVTKCRNIDKLKNNDRTIKQPRIKDKEQLKSRTPPLDQRPKQQHVSQIVVKDTNINKFHRSRTPEKLLSRVKRDLTPPLRHQDKQLILQKTAAAAAAAGTSSSSIRNRDIDKHEFHKNKERDDNLIRKNETFHKRTINQLPDNQRKNIIDERNSRSRIKEHHEKEQRNDRNQQRFDQQQQHKERDDIVDHRTRERTRERDKDLIKIRERELPLLSSSPSGSFDKSRYREKEKDDKINSRDRRIDRNDRDMKILERERITQRFDRISEKNERCERLERFPPERSLDKTINTKNITSNIREHNITEQIYERGQANRHRIFNQRFERGHSSTMIDHERKDIVTAKLERRDSPRQNIEFERGYTRLPNDHWEQSDESTTRIDYHSHDDERRKVPIETRKFINDRRPRDDTRPQSRYPVQDQRSFDDHHHHHHPVHPGHPGHPGHPSHPIHSAHQTHQIHPVHQLYNNANDKLKNGNDKWELPHEIEKHNRDRRYNNNNEWEEREWRPPAPRNPGIWDCETVTRPSDKKDDWTERYDNPRPEWKIGENRKWENPALLLRNAAYRNERLKEMEHGANESGPHAKRRVPFNNPPVGENRDEKISTTSHTVNPIHPSKQLQPSSTLTSTSTVTLPSKTSTQAVTATTTTSTTTTTATTTIITTATTSTISTAATTTLATTTTTSTVATTTPAATITIPATTITTTPASSSTTIVSPTSKEETINKKLIELSEGKIITDNNLIQKQITNENIKNELQDTIVPEIKKLDDSLQTHHVAESDLSDISDDPDDILNMDDVEESQKKLLKNEKIDSSIVLTPINNNTNNNNDNNNQEKSIVKTNINDNIADDGGTSVIKQDKDKDDPITTSIDDENLETMDFEEISDGELEEDIKTSGKGLGDALGVDWESLVKEIQPKWPTSSNESAHSRWQPKEIFRRIGISKKLAGNDFVDSFISELCSDDDHDDNDYLLNGVAMMHTALLRHKLINNSTKKNSLFNINFNSFTINKIHNPDILKPFTSLYDEAKFLLEQKA